MTPTIRIDASTTGTTVSEDALRAGIDAFRAVLDQSGLSADRLAAEGIACWGHADEEAAKIWHDANRAGLNAVEDAGADSSAVSFSIREMGA